jgi:DNA end-binding protein Ku
LELTTRNKLAPSRLSPESVGVAKSFKVDTDTDVEVSKDELENIALESNRTIDINEFVPKADPRYLILTVLSPAGWQVGHDAFAVIRETIRRSY